MRASIARPHEAQAHPGQAEEGGGLQEGEVLELGVGERAPAVLLRCGEGEPLQRGEHGREEDEAPREDREAVGFSSTTPAFNEGRCALWASGLRTDTLAELKTREELLALYEGETCTDGDREVTEGARFWNELEPTPGEVRVFALPLQVHSGCKGDFRVEGVFRSPSNELAVGALREDTAVGAGSAPACDLDFAWRTELIRVRSSAEGPAEARIVEVESFGECS